MHIGPTPSVTLFAKTEIYLVLNHETETGCRCVFVRLIGDDVKVK